MIRPPAPAPCGSCPYRRDVPSGVWDAEEYAKLPPYDLATPEQPRGVFLCHQQDGRVCAGWCGTHDMNESLGLRMAAAIGEIDAATWDAILDYESPVPLFASGQDAADHGLLDIKDPSSSAVRTIAKLARRRLRRSS